MASIVVSVLWFLITWRYGFDLADEGYYWYGSQRTAYGDIPLRDFQSYDIGRYYWAALFMYIMGNYGIFPAHLSVFVLQATGVFIGVYLCLITSRLKWPYQWVLAFIIALILNIWILPYYKGYDHFISIGVVMMLYVMLKSQKHFTWLFAGIFLGIAAIIGRNHGVYGIISSIFLIALLLFKAPSKKTIATLSGYFLLGVFIGFSPTLILMLSANGFADAFVNSILLMFKQGSTNIFLPIPWPWAAKSAGLSGFWSLSVLFLGIGLIFLLAFIFCGLIFLALTRFNLNNTSKKVFYATVAAAIPYAHYSFARADTIHLTLGILPALIGLLVAINTLKGLRPIFLTGGILAVTLLTLDYVNPYLSKVIIGKDYVKYNIGGSQLWINDDLSQFLQRVDQDFQKVPAAATNFLAIPNMPSLHAMYHCKMPIWEIYGTGPMAKDFELSEINRLESSPPEIIFLSDNALDKNPALTYSKMHPATYEWINSRYTLFDSLGSDMRIYLLTH
ncbi:MAG: hypothetical protein PHW13_09315 [Methylococcales bacterium]|nr:hypothetical protein [Methylococcales bacterium]